MCDLQPFQVVTIDQLPLLPEAVFIFHVIMVEHLHCGRPQLVLVLRDLLKVRILQGLMCQEDVFEGIHLIPDKFLPPHLQWVHGTSAQGVMIASIEHIPNAILGVHREEN